MLEFSDLPYKFVPPKPNRLIIGLGRLINRFIGLPSRNHLIRKIRLTGKKGILEIAKNPKARYIIVCNHPTHSDPQVVNEICRRIGVKPAFMAAYDVFARSEMVSWIMQRIGAFSIDRDASDRKAMKCAGEIIEQGKFPLVIFPEGNVYLCNDRVTPFAEGAAFIALRAQMKLGNDEPVYAVPISLKYTHIEDVRSIAIIKLRSIAKQFKDTLSNEEPILDEITRISILTLAEELKDHGYETPNQNIDVEHLIERTSENIIQKLEQELNISSQKDTESVSRIRKIRSKIHSLRIDTENKDQHKTFENIAAEAMLALRILGYSGGYAKQNPSLDRVTETIIRLHEDVHSEIEKPLGKRDVFANIGTPIDLRSRINSDGKIERNSIAKLTEDLERSIQDDISKINKKNDSIGNELF